jgi:hypothetical protein
MEINRIKQYLRDGRLRERSIDVPRIKSLIESAKTNAGYVMKLPITEESATTVFRGLYESIRQLGDARWFSLGYEPTSSHEVCMEILKEIRITESVKLNRLDNFRKIRNSINYGGYSATVGQAKEISDFWASCGTELISFVEKSIKKR